MVKILILPDKKSIEVKIEGKAKLIDLLKKLEVDPDTVIVVVNNSLVENLDIYINEDDNLKIIYQGVGG